MCLEGGLVGHNLIFAPARCRIATGVLGVLRRLSRLPVVIGRASRAVRYGFSRVFAFSLNAIAAFVFRFNHNSRGGPFGRDLSYVGRTLSVRRMWGTVGAHFTSRQLCATESYSSGAASVPRDTSCSSLMTPGSPPSGHHRQQHSFPCSGGDFAVWAARHRCRGMGG